MSVLVRFPTARCGADSTRVPRGTLLLDAVRAAGLPVASGCGAHALCARCAVEVVDGAEALEPASAEEREALRRNRIDPRLRLACRVRVGADLSVRTSYW